MGDMDICDELLETKKCFKWSYQLLDNLNVVYNSSNSMMIFWNKYQLFLYENLNFEDVTRIFAPEFIVRQIVIANNYLVCLDRNGNVHVTSLKFKNTQKRLKTTFQPREQNILAFVQCGEYILSLKSESATYFLCLNRINSDFQAKQKIQIQHEDTWLLSDTTQEKCLLTVYKLSEHDEDIRQLFNSKAVIPNESYIIIITLDIMNVFACLLSPNMVQKDIQLIKLYSCPSEICNMQVIELEELSVIVVLKSGTVIKLPLRKTSHTVPVHLNTAVYKFLLLKDTLMYTDGVSMWKTENTFTKIKFHQFFIRDVKDFIRVGDQMICTTFSNLIYLIPDDESSYLKPENELYCPAQTLLNNTEYLYKLLEEVDKNNELIKKLNIEANYITALALSNRQDLMDSILKNDIVVYDHYQDAIKDTPDLTITEHLEEYFKDDSVYILVKLKVKQMELLVDQVLAQVFHNSKIHVSLFSEHKLLTTISLNIESLNKMNILIPVGYKLMLNVSTIKVNIKIVAHLPGVFDPRESTWTTLYKKEVVLNSEHFIKTDLMSSTSKSLKDPQETTDKLIAKTASKQHGSLFNITETNTESTTFAMYVKLPVNYTDIFKNQELFNHLNKKKAEHLSKELGSAEFLESKSNLTFEVGRHKVDIEILTGETPVLRVSSSNVSKALSLRNFLADFLYKDYKTAGPELQFADYAFYTTVENLQKAIKDRMESSDSAELQDLAEEFQKTAVGDLPV